MSGILLRLSVSRVVFCFARYTRAVEIQATAKRRGRCEHLRVKRKILEIDFRATNTVAGNLVLSYVHWAFLQRNVVISHRPASAEVPCSGILKFSVFLFPFF